MTTSGGKTFRVNLWVALPLIALVGTVLGLLLPPTGRDFTRSRFGGPTMGTHYTVAISPRLPPDVGDIKRQVDERLAQINRRMSTYDPNSELSRFNQLDSNDWFSVSAETAQVVAAALEIAERTSGAFDPTVGPVVNLWGFGPDKWRPEPPTDEAIAAALTRVGYEKMSVRIDPPALKKTNPAIYLDLSGIAKGYASDAISALLDELGIANTMVEIGGEVRTRGFKSNNVPWRIGVEQPEDRGMQFHAAVNLVNAGMATSGDYRNFFEHEGVRYSHTIDPTTGRPVQHSLAAASIVAPTCMEADALATAVLVMGDEKGYDWCMENNVAAMLLVRQGEQIVERVTPKFQERMEKR